MTLESLSPAINHNPATIVTIVIGRMGAMLRRRSAPASNSAP
jgi:hypothetical protein